MEQMLNNVEISMSLLKISGVILLLIGILFMFKVNFVFHSHWKNILLLGGIVGAINAGLVLSFGGVLFILTPTILAFFVSCYCLNRFPLYKLKHLLGLSVSFVFTSAIFFLSIAGIFFHLAVEGKI